MTEPTVDLSPDAHAYRMDRLWEALETLAPSLYGEIVDAFEAYRSTAIARIEAAFVPVETVATVDAALARATARAEAAEARIKVMEEALRDIKQLVLDDVAQAIGGEDD